MFFRFFAGQILSCFFCLLVYSETLIIQSSDQHSSYKKMLNFLAAIEVLSSQFKKKHPEGRIALVINGDVSSYTKNSWESLDRGQLIYEVLSQLAKKYFVVYTFGNHDAFDWNDSRLFLDQAILLKEGGVNLVTANADFYLEYQNLFRSHADLVSPSGTIIRFIGYTLSSSKKPDRLEKFQRRGPKIIENIKGINLNLPLREANRQRSIKSVVVSMHMGLSKAKTSVSQLDPSLGKKLKLVFAGHDHKQEMIKFNQVQIIDSGAYFSFSAVLLSDRGQVLSKEFFNEDSQKNIAGFVDENSLEAQLIEQAKEVISELMRLKKPRRKKAIASLKGGSLTGAQGAQKKTKERKLRCIRIFQKRRAVNIY